MVLEIRSMVANNEGDSFISDMSSEELDENNDFFENEHQQESEDLQYLEEEVDYEEEDEEENLDDEDTDINDGPLLSDDQVRREVYSLFLSAYRIKFGSTDKETHSLLHFLRIALADTVGDSTTCFLPKSFKTLEKEFDSDEIDIIQYMDCGKCHTLYKLADYNVS